MKGGLALEGLVVGSYCHDVLLRGSRVVGETLGGAAAFVSNVLDAASPPEASFSVISKVGPDFAYASAPAPAQHPPLLCPAPTTSFHARFSDAVASAHAPDRQLRRVHACDPIYPDDLPERRFAYGEGGVPETLEWMIRLCRAVLVDAQGLIRVFDAEGGGSGTAVRHTALEGCQGSWSSTRPTRRRYRGMRSTRFLSNLLCAEIDRVKKENDNMQIQLKQVLGRTCRRCSSHGQLRISPGSTGRSTILGCIYCQ